MLNIWTIIQKDFRVLFKDVYRMLYLLAAPLVMVLIAHFALPTGDSDKPLMRVPVVQLDQGQSATDFVANLKKVTSIEWETEDLTDKKHPTELTEGKAAELLPKRKAYVLIPSDFSAKIESKQPTSIRIVADPSDHTVATTVYQIVNNLLAPEAAAMTGRQVITDVVDGYTKELAKQNVTVNPQPILDRAIANLQQSIASPPLKADVQTQSVSGEKKQTNAFVVYVPGFAVMFMLFGATTAAAALLQDREEGIIGRLRTMPISMSQVLYGKMISNFLLMFFQAAVLFIAAKLVFGMTWGNDLFALVLMIVSTAFAATGLGLLIASFATTFSQVTAVMPIIILSMSAIGGSWWPLFMEPDAVQKVARVTVNAWSTEGFHTLLIYGGTLTDIAWNLAVLFGMGLLYILIATIKFRKKL